jgi:hypothetical protein
MGYLGYKPADKPLTAADITDSIITSAKIVDGSIVNADINASSAIAISKIAATGTSNQVLRMNTGATALEFATPASGSYTFLGETSASNVSSVSLNGYFTSDYDIYKIFIDGLYGSSNDAAIRITFNTTGSYTEQTADYAGALFYLLATGNNAGSTSYDANLSTSSMFGGYSNSSTSTNGTAFDLTLYNPLGTDNHKVLTFLSNNNSGDLTRQIVAIGSAMWRQQTALTGIRFKMLSGNIYARKLKIYGVKNS